jgi:prophage regulatory protein
MRNLRLSEVQYKTGLSKPGIYKFIQLGKFPRPSKIGCASVWLESEIDEWIANCHAGRDQAPAAAKVVAA